MVDFTHSRGFGPTSHKTGRGRGLSQLIGVKRTLVVYGWSLKRRENRWFKSRKKQSDVEILGG